MKRISAGVMAVFLVFLMVGCAVNSDTNLYKSKDGDWSIRMPKELVKDKEESDEELKSYTVYFKAEAEPVVVINEVVDEKLEINEDKLKEEFSLDNYLHVERYETIDIENFGKAYGALVLDEVTNTTILYYRLKHKDKAVSFIIYWKDGFSLEQEAKAKAMIGTFKGLK